jgi:Ricin-type beta-trefoil lectin domain
MSKYIIRTALSIIMLFSFITPTINALNFPRYLMPFKYNEVWDTDLKSGRDFYGIHQDRTGYAIDFYAPVGSGGDVVAPSDGWVRKGCSVGDASFVHFRSIYGDNFRLIHLSNSSLITQGGEVYVRQGGYIGKVHREIGNFNTSSCSLSNDDVHVHFSWTSNLCPINIDNYRFDCNDMRLCDGTYKVNCNKKYVDLDIYSTNKEWLNNSECDLNLTNLSRKNNEINNNLDIKLCLKRAGILPKNYPTNNDYDQYAIDARNRILYIANGKEIQAGKGLVIDVAGSATSLGSKLHLWESNGTNAQKFYYEKETNLIRWGDKCLGTNSGSMLDKIVLVNCNVLPQNQWMYDTNKRLVNLSKKLCIDASDYLNRGSILHLHTCHNLNNQQFNNNLNFNFVNFIVPSIYIDPTFLSRYTTNEINSKDVPNLVLDVAGNENRIGNSVNLWSRNGTPAQKFTYDKVTNNITWKDKCVGTDNGNFLETLKLLSCNDSLALKWKYDNKGRLVNLQNKLCLDAKHYMVQGSPLHLYKCHNLPNQKFINKLEFNIVDFVVPEI